MSDTRKQLRLQLRKKRNALSNAEQTRASNQLLKAVVRLPIFVRSKHIAFYIASDGEIDPGPLMQKAMEMGKACYLPILNPFKHNNLWFGAYKSGDELLINYFNIPEPPAEKGRFPAWALDLVLMPLVGFDRQGHRLGMGGGFYDRTFSFLGDKKKCKPVLMGLAHNCQEVASLKCESWDIPLDFIASDHEVLSTKSLK